jgi:hypothetical protein
MDGAAAFGRMGGKRYPSLDSGADFAAFEYYSREAIRTGLGPEKQSKSAQLDFGPENSASPWRPQRR